MKKLTIKSITAAKKIVITPLTPAETKAIKGGDDNTTDTNIIVVDIIND